MKIGLQLVLLRRAHPTISVLKWIEAGPEFSEEETGLILQGIPFEKLPAETQDKWKWLGLSEDFDVFPRNLRALLKKSERE